MFETVKGVSDNLLAKNHINANMRLPVGVRTLVTIRARGHLIKICNEIFIPGYGRGDILRNIGN